jgi:transposase InsO family protein
MVHLAVTAHPTAAWTAQQLREAFPWDDAHRYLIRDQDLAVCRPSVTTAEAMAITEVLTALPSPWQNGHVERFIGSVRRECVDHVIVFNAVDLRRVLKRYIEYHTRSRTHLSLEKDPAEPPPPGNGQVIAIPQVGGLHHRYERRAA